MKGKNEAAQFSVYKTQDETWMWMIGTKWATIPNFPSKGKRDTQAEANQAALAYLREAERVKYNPRHIPSLETVVTPVIKPQPHTIAPQEAPAPPVQPMTTAETHRPSAAIPQAAVSLSNDDDIVMLDTSYFIHRSFHGIQSPLKNADGTPTNAVYGFCKAILKLIEEKKPKLLLAVMDPGGKTWRHDVYPEYKSGREEKPDLEIQKPICEEFLRVIGVKMAKIPYYEADDVIGTLAKNYSPARRVVIESRDKDLMQLVTERVTLSDIYENKKITLSEVVAKFGVDPDKVADVLALAGDSSDNIPGVPDVGEKTAAALIVKYGSLENILANAAEIKGKRGENIAANKELALICKKLTTIDTNAPVSIKAEECTYSADPAAVVSFLQKYDLNSLIKEFASSLTAAPVAPPAKADKIEEFRGEYFFLSNFYKTPAPIMYSGQPFPTSEHLFQSFKTTDKEWKEKVRTAPTAGEAKKLGYQVPIRPDWETRKIEAMKLCLDLKFSQPVLQEKLLETGEALLVEGNTWKDVYWGVCDGKGENHLGKLLMEKRDALRPSPPWD